jgi:DNA-binding HxlR family transcriptional regulator
MRTYGQYCPIARASELLAERWTPILLRNLLAGCRTFGELLDGAPGISRALLAQRLELLEHHGIITKTTSTGRVRVRYELTEKGRELKAVTDAMGNWGARWLELEPAHTDPAYVLWATSRLVDVDRLPLRALIARVDLRDRPRERYWLLLHRPVAEVCTTYPGRDEDLVITADSETLARWHLRHVTYEQARSAGQLKIDGHAQDVRAFLQCLRPSPFAAVRPVSDRAPAVAR